jgi:multidrug efflux pump
VTLVVYLFLRNFRATLIPSVAVPVSILGTFGAMYLLGYSLDILSLMALTIATGFVVDDAIVVLENISRHLEQGMPRLEAALLGAREVGFTVLSISLSLIAVFIPILLMGGILGRLFREFTVTLSLAIIISLAISLTTTPMMCALFLRTRPPREAASRRSLFDRVLGGYERSLDWALHHRRLVLLIFFGAIGLNILLFYVVPKGFFPEEDTGNLFGLLQADQSISFQAMTVKLRQMMAIVQQDPAVETVVGFTGANSGFGGSSNSGSVIVALKSIEQRPPIDQVIARLRPKLAQVPGGSLFLNAVQDIRAGGRQSGAQYQYTLQSDSVDDLFTWTPQLVTALEHSSVMADVSSDQQQKGLESDLVYDRDTASRLGITPAQIDNTLYDAFGQRQVSVIYSAVNQYHVVMEIDPRYTQYPQSLQDVYVATSGGGASGTATSNLSAGTVTAATSTAAPISASASASAAASANNNSARNAATNALANAGKSSTSTGAAVSTSLETMIPLAAIAHYNPGSTPLSVNHQGLFVASTISFNLQPGQALGDAAIEIRNAVNQIHMPASIHGSLAGTAQVFQQSLGNEPVLIAAAIAAVYILLGVLYESYIHPITILSTLPSAGIGALLALMLFRLEFDILGFIGVILLIGIVKKNAIMMIDFAIEAKRSQNMSSYDAIFQACVLRFRPIMMTTTAAILGAVPLALSFGNGGEIRRPLGISIMGGLLISQLLTLYTTPVVYLYLDQVGQWSLRTRRRLLPRLFDAHPTGDGSFDESR